MWLIIEVPGCVLLLRDDGYSSRFHLVVFNAIALVVQDTRCLVTYDEMEWLPGLVVSPVPPPPAS